MITQFRGITRMGTAYTVSLTSVIFYHNGAGFTHVKCFTPEDRASICDALNDGAEPGEWLNDYGEVFYNG